MQWCVETFAGEAKGKAREQGITANELLEREYQERNPDGPSGMLVLPHFAGAATPYMDIGSKGVILGLTT
ncbi:carbohydrate kinase, partial [Klebsiella oxytoca]